MRPLVKVSRNTSQSASLFIDCTQFRALLIGFFPLTDPRSDSGPARKTVFLARKKSQKNISPNEFMRQRWFEANENIF
jgi:hypothetical protein